MNASSTRLSILATACLGATLLSLSASAEDASDAGCRTAWNNSPAAASCKLVELVPNGFKCEISARCLSNGKWGETTKVSKDIRYISRLVFENGTLKLNSNAEFESRAYPRE